MMATLRFLVPAVLLLGMGCAASRPEGAPPPSGRFAFALVGDTPYTEEEETQFLRLIDEVNQDKLAWVIHVGDIGRFSCSDAHFLARFQMFQQIQHPFMFTPGDNEWTDCHMEFRGGLSPLERLNRVRDIFFPDPAQSTGGRVLPLTSQSQDPAYVEFVENARWVYGGIVFLTIHLVGSHNGLDAFDTRTAADDSSVVRRETAALAWLREGFDLAREEASQAVVIALHANPGFEAAVGAEARRGFDPFLAALEEEVRQYPGKVLLAHGDTHNQRIDTPLVDSRSGQRLENFTRVEVFGSPFVGWIKVVVDPTRPALFSFQAKQMD